MSMQLVCDACGEPIRSNNEGVSINISGEPGLDVHAHHRALILIIGDEERSQVRVAPDFFDPDAR